MAIHFTFLSNGEKGIEKKRGRNELFSDGREKGVREAFVRMSVRWRNASKYGTFGSFGKSGTSRKFPELP
ncbi:MAG: hypothetical protein KBS70_03310 [Bacteroidales bacterium]|nr:hypothetical protein [Candidatus Colicola equi]